MKCHIYHTARLHAALLHVCMLAIAMLLPAVAGAQRKVTPQRSMTQHRFQTDKTLADSTAVPMATIQPIDSMLVDSAAIADSLRMAMGDTVHHHVKRDWATWKPEVKRAMWLALVLPGAGQIYNRKFWKLPIFYGGFVGCAYAMRWNGMMYHDYSQAYLDIMDSDPNTQSYNKFLHLGTQITDADLAKWQEIFRKRKDRYRRWRDLGFFAMVGVYALSVIDAYVDASLSQFDISPDLSFQVSPTIINGNGRSFGNAGLGLQCQVTF